MIDELNDIHANCEEELAALRSRLREGAQNINNRVELAIAHLIKGVLSSSETMAILRDIQSDAILLGAMPVKREDER